MFTELRSIPEDDLRWTRYPLLRGVPAFDIRHGLVEFPNGRLEYVNKGDKGAVFRFFHDEIDMTVKVHFINRKDVKDIIKKLCRLSNTRVTNDTLDWLCYPQPGRNIVEGSNRVLSAVAGHVLGGQVKPDYIDAPICIWGIQRRGVYYAAGYSIPFIEGKPVKIHEDYDLAKTADLLEGYSGPGLYVGDRGKFGGSHNAIITDAGVKKFIDVRLGKNHDLEVKERKVERLNTKVLY